YLFTFELARRGTARSSRTRGNSTRSSRIAHWDAARRTVGDGVVGVLVLCGAIYAVIVEVHLRILNALGGGNGNGKHLARRVACRALEAARGVNIEPTEGDRIWAGDRPSSGYAQPH
ncbi:hypothetical protein EVG20_g10607, partial [Dentipellis fragilis]